MSILLVKKIRKNVCLRSVDGNYKIAQFFLGLFVTMVEIPSHP